MGLFGKLVRTTINVAIGLPVAVVKDVVTMGNVSNPQEECHTTQAIELIKKEAD